jgi:hypothetical protein
MTPTSTFRAFLSTFFALGLAGAVGCVITSGDIDDDTDGRTTSDSGGSMCGANSSLSGTTCFCDAGFDWCDLDDLTNLDCCPTGGTDTASGTGTGGTDTDGTDTSGGTGGPDCTDAVFPTPSEACTAELEGALYCSTLEMECLGESSILQCTGGQWVDISADQDASCQFDGFDFYVGCWDDGTGNINLFCGDGPGTACDGSVPAACVDADVLSECAYGREFETSCATLCQTVGDGTQQFDFGYCGELEAGGFDCLCCDLGEPGCEGAGTTTDGSTTDGSTTDTGSGTDSSTTDTDSGTDGSTTDTSSGTDGTTTN